MVDNKNSIVDFLQSISEDKIVSIAGATASGKSWLTFYLCEYFLLKNKKVLLIDTACDGVIVERVTQSYNVKHKIENFNCSYISNAEEILKLIKNYKDTIVIVENLNSIHVAKSIDGDGFGDRAKTIAYLMRSLRQIAIDNNLNILTTNSVHHSVSTNSINISGSNSIVFVSDTVISCEKDKTTMEMKFKVIKSRNGVFLHGESILSLEKIIKCFIRKQKIKKLLSI